jgi:hypothetical protein
MDTQGGGFWLGEGENHTSGDDGEVLNSGLRHSTLGQLPANSVATKLIGTE